MAQSCNPAGSNQDAFAIEMIFVAYRVERIPPELLSFGPS
jgi:hypothetical protein